MERLSLAKCDSLGLERCKERSEKAENFSPNQLVIQTLGDRR